MGQSEEIGQHQHQESTERENPAHDYHSVKSSDERRTQQPMSSATFQGMSTYWTDYYSACTHGAVPDCSVGCSDMHILVLVWAVSVEL